jgi:hypothetical protein
LIWQKVSKRVRVCRSRFGHKQTPEADPFKGQCQINGMDAPFLNRHRGAKVEVRANPL